MPQLIGTPRTHADVAEQTHEYLSTKQVSQITSTPEATLRYWRHRDEGPASFKLGSRVVYRRSDIEQWIADQEAATRRGGAVLA